MKRTRFGKNLVALRNKRGLTQHGLARKLRLNRQSIRQYEEQRAEPPYYRLIKICRFFNVKIEKMLIDPLYRKTA